MTKRPSLDQLQLQVYTWNKRHPIGTPVLVQLDDGSIKAATTRDLAWVMGGHSAMIMLDGIAGGYSLDRVKPKN